MQKLKESIQAALLNTRHLTDPFKSYALGCILTLSFAPFYFLPAIVISFTGLLFLLEKFKNKRRIFWMGWWFGFGHFMSGLYWFSHALMTDIDKFGWMIPFALTLVPAALGIFTGLVTLGSSYFNSSNTTKAIAFTAIWVIIEMFRSNFIIPFPWNLLGYSISGYDTTLQIASLTGLYGTSLILVFIGAALYSKSFKMLTGALLICFIIFGYGSYRLNNKTTESYNLFKIRLVQPSILEHPMGDKAKQDSALVKLVELSFLERDPKVKYVIWPEAAFPFGFTDDFTSKIPFSKIAPKDGALIFGSDRIQRKENGDLSKIYNSILAISDKAEILASYNKETLVPFGEFIPFRSILPFLDKVTPGDVDFSSGDNTANIPNFLDLPPFLPLICYETIFPNLNIQNAKWILNITNDAWFGKSIGPHQHFAMSRFRSAEYGLPVIRVANNGISAVISPYGEIIQKLRTNDVGIIDVDLPKSVSVPNTHFKRFFTVLPFILLLIAIYYEYCNRRRKI